jgi:carbonic anhydrase
LVHFNTKYGSFADATAHSDGLAVLGIFLKVMHYFLDTSPHLPNKLQKKDIILKNVTQIGPGENPFFRPVVDQLGDVLRNHDETVLTNLVSFKDLLPKQTTSFYRYSGSLTTPFCQQIVIWTVFDTPVEVSEKQASYPCLQCTVKKVVIYTSIKSWSFCV